MLEAYHVYEATSIPGVRLLEPRIMCDSRGSFTKLIHEPSLARAGLPGQFSEVFISTSVSGVIRGLHLQVPPFAYHKLVCCVAGHVFDVLLDLRGGSPAYGKHAVLELSGESPLVVSVPPGVAHGFAALADSLMLYATTVTHHPSADTGVRWDSAGVDWPLSDPIVSERDTRLPGMDSFVSEFEFDSRETGVPSDAGERS